MTSVKQKKSEVKKQTEADYVENETRISPQKAPLIDGRVFEADRELDLSEEEKKEMQEFHATLKKYHKLSRDMLKEATEEEKKELDTAKKSPKNKYYEGTTAERIDHLEETAKIIEERQKLAEEKKKKQT